MYHQITINEVLADVNSIRAIEVPYGDNEGDAINSSSIMSDLTEYQKGFVIKAVNTVEEYICGQDGYPDNKAIGRIRSKGIDIYIGPDQYDPYKYIGKVRLGEWDMNISLDI
jgi:hypothetical protein